MNAGVIKSKFKKTDLDKAIKEFKVSALPAIAQHKGARSAFLLVNRETGEALSIGLYDDEAAAKAFGPKAEKVAEKLKKYMEKAAVKRVIYEVAAGTQQEARQVVERGMKAFNAHDLEAMARDSAPDIESTAPGDIKLKGPQAAKEYNQKFITAFPDARVEATRIFTAGNTVIVEGIFTGTHDGTMETPMGDVPATGRKVRGEFIEVIEVDRGLVKRDHLIYDQVQLMTQLGLAPAAPNQAAHASQGTRPTR
ncbi:MAG: ester cyclase [Candidatus Dormibacteraeota bacterium]|nr:ester cyclase [Candidatus Dormibacteraeota bacterium]